MKILIIGNGFDLAHGLKTRYTDFLEFLHGIYSSEEEYTKHADIVEEFRWIDNETWTKLFEDRKNMLNGRWEGFEAEIKRIAELIDQLHANAATTEKVKISPQDGKILGYFDEKFAVEDFSCLFEKEEIDNLKDKMSRSLLELIRQLEMYISKRINPATVSYRLMQVCDFRPDKVISFNYSNTYERLYGLSEDNICYVHGKAQDEYDLSSYNLEEYDESRFLSSDDYMAWIKTQECNMVLGIDEYQNDIDSQEDNYCIQFKKFYQRIIKKTGNKYIDWLKQSETDPNGLEVVFFGHSMDLIDKELIREIVQSKNRINNTLADVTILHHDNESLERHVQNMVKIIGEKNVIERVHGEDATMHFEMQDNTRIDV